jgi:hypothetical protein
LNKNMATGLVLAFAALTSLAAISSAQLGVPWSDPFSDDYEPWSNWEGYYSWEERWPQNMPTTLPVSEPSGAYSDSPPTTDRLGGSQPTNTPSASTSSPISYLKDGESLSESELGSLPGGSSLMPSSGGWDTPLTSSGDPDVFSDYYGGGQDRYGRYYGGYGETGGYYGGTQAYYGGYYGYGGIQQWIYYSGIWTYGPAALWFGQRTNTIIRTDQYQRIWSYERYPNGYEDWQYWGYWSPGYHHAWFGADARGWHQIAVWGSRSGWSNPIWVYVW